MIQFVSVKKTFSIRNSRRKIHALRNVTLDLPEEGTTGIVGESGSGKSTLARIFLGQYKPDSGHFTWNSYNSNSLTKKDWQKIRSQISVVFQDPFSSLNPRLKVSSILREPMLIHKKLFPMTKKEQFQRASEVLEMTGLPISALDKHPHEFSGGQRQRIGIARSLVLSPKVIVLDEPVSALDVSVKAQIINLLQDLKEKLKVTYLFIAHDLGVVHHISDKIVVLYLGMVMEEGDADEVFFRPRHPYTRTLLDSVPSLEKIGEKFLPISGEIPSPSEEITLCPFLSRCPRAGELCQSTMPDYTSHEKGSFFCHYPLIED